MVKFHFLNTYLTSFKKQWSVLKLFWVNNLYWSLKLVSLYMPERRQAEAARIREKYPDRIPVWLLFVVIAVVCVSLLFWSITHWLLQVVVERAEKSDVPEIDKKKWVISCSCHINFNNSFLLCFYLWHLWSLDIIDVVLTLSVILMFLSSN